MKSSQTFYDHLRELRRRVLWIILTIGVSGLIGYVFRVPVIHFIQKPLGAPLYYTSPAGSFNFTLKISYVLGMFIALPLIVFQLIKFVEPALPIRIKNRFLLKVIGASFLLALLGASFGFFILVPTSLHFFSGYSTAVIKPLISANEYLSYIVNIIITFSLLFQIPLLILFINYVRPLKPRDLLKYQKHIIIGSFILAVLLPFTYDPISQFVMAVPIIFLYYLSIFLLIIVNHRKKFLQDSASDQPEEVELFETDPSPISAIQGIAPVAVGPMGPMAQTNPQGGRGMLDSVIGSFQYRKPASNSLETPASGHTISAEVNDQSLGNTHENTANNKSGVLDGFLPSRKTKFSSEPIDFKVESSDQNIINREGLVYKHYDARESEQKPRTMDGFLPSPLFKTIKPGQNKLDDMQHFGVP